MKSVYDPDTQTHTLYITDRDLNTSKPGEAGHLLFKLVEMIAKHGNLEVRDGTRALVEGVQLVNFEHHGDDKLPREYLGVW